MSFRNASTFFKVFRARVRGVSEEQIVDAVRGLALEGLTGVVTLTPVDTGRLRGAWDLEVGRETIADVPPNPEGRSPVSEGVSKVAGMRKPENVRIVNNVEYGRYVNDGTPNVPPVLMVERTLSRLGAR